jgi:hypothetical protein
MRGSGTIDRCRVDRPHAPAQLPPDPPDPPDPLERAEHRAWIEVGSSVLADISGFYLAPDKGTRLSSFLVTRRSHLPGLMVAIPHNPSSPRPG